MPGGLGPAAADSAVLIRQNAAGASTRFTIDLGELVASGAAATALTPVRAGGVVFVP